MAKPTPPPRILSFTPAHPGWRAVYWERDTGDLIFEDISGWAVVENWDGTETFTTAEACSMDGALAVPLGEASNLLGVLGPSNDALDSYRIEARHRFAALKAKETP